MNDWGKLGRTHRVRSQAYSNDALQPDLIRGLVALSGPGLTKITLAWGVIAHSSLRAEIQVVRVKHH